MNSFLNTLKNQIKKTFLYDILKYVRGERDILNWNQQGRMGPPPHLYKQRVVKHHANLHKKRVFIETGTYLGEMTNAVNSLFDHVYTIELSVPLSEQAKHRFRNNSRITVFQGSSDEVLPHVLSKIPQSCLFWLDAHYSGGITARGIDDTPILRELQKIFDHPIKDHVILIDDSRCFVGQDGYPTIDELRHFLNEKQPNYTFEVADDIICIEFPAKI